MKTRLIVLIAVLALSAGCACATPHTVQKQSNLAAYLFGGAPVPTPAQKAPLTLPAKVGIAFVPNDQAMSTIPETTKKQVLDTVRDELVKHRPYVAGAQIIPSTYLCRNGGVSNLQQVATMFDVDVIVVLGANQFQKHERNSLAAFLDLTVVGAFVIPGNTVETSTVLEAAVYHVPSRALIFRADGANRKTSRSTAYGASHSARDAAETSIAAASKDLVIAIGKALVEFDKFDASKSAEITPSGKATGNVTNKQQTTDRQQNYWGRVTEYRTAGGGSFDAAWILVMGVGAICAASTRKW